MFLLIWQVYEVTLPVFWSKFSQQSRVFFSIGQKESSLLESISLSLSLLISRIDKAGFSGAPSVCTLLMTHLYQLITVIDQCSP